MITQWPREGSLNWPGPLIGFYCPCVGLFDFKTCLICLTFRHWNEVFNKAIDWDWFQDNRDSCGRPRTFGPRSRTSLVPLRPDVSKLRIFGPYIFLRYRNHISLSKLNFIILKYFKSAPKGKFWRRFSRCNCLEIAAMFKQDGVSSVVAKSSETHVKIFKFVNEHFVRVFFEKIQFWSESQEK